MHISVVGDYNITGIERLCNPRYQKYQPFIYSGDLTGDYIYSGDFIYPFVDHNWQSDAVILAHEKMELFQRNKLNIWLNHTMLAFAIGNYRDIFG